MKTVAGIPANTSLPVQQAFRRRPGTKLGWWSVGLAATFVLLFINNVTLFGFMPSPVEGSWRQSLLPIYAIFMLVCGLAAGIAGLVALVSRHERSWLVWLALLPGLLVALMILGELLAPG